MIEGWGEGCDRAVTGLVYVVTGKLSILVMLLSLLGIPSHVMDGQIECLHCCERSLNISSSRSMTIFVVGGEKAGLNRVG